MARNYTYEPANPVCTGDFNDFLMVDKKGNPVVDNEGNQIYDWKKWEAARSGQPGVITLGASDSAVVEGLSPWTSRTELIALKKGKKPKLAGNNNTDALDCGHIYEAAIRSHFAFWARENGKNIEVRDETRIFIHGNPDYKFAHVNLDGLCVEDGEVGVVEIKSTTTRNMDAIKNYWQQGICPPYYECQVRHEMAVMNLNFAYIICAWGLRTSEIAVIKIVRDLQLEADLMNAEREFYERYIVGDEEFDEREEKPSVLMSYYGKAYDSLIEEKDSEAVEIGSDYQKAVETLLQLNEEIEELEGTLKKLQEEKLSSYVELANVCEKENVTSLAYQVDENKRLFIDIKQECNRDSYDLEAMKLNDPDLYEKGIKPSVSFNKSQITKVADKALLQKYLIKGTPKGSLSCSESLYEYDKDGVPVKKNGKPLAKNQLAAAKKRKWKTTGVVLPA